MNFAIVWVLCALIIFLPAVAGKNSKSTGYEERAGLYNRLIAAYAQRKEKPDDFKAVCQTIAERAAATQKTTESAPWDVLAATALHYQTGSPTKENLSWQEIKL